MAQVVTLIRTNCVMLHSSRTHEGWEVPASGGLQTEHILKGFLCQVEAVSEVHTYMPQLGRDKATEGQCKNSTRVLL